ncbi:MAG: DUF2071 domain-containing protein [Verrucomicrobiota bacterium]
MLKQLETTLAEERLAHEGGPLMRAAWRDVLMIHFLIDPAELQGHVPFELDLCEGWAVVTLVAFRMEEIRLEVAIDFPNWIMAPAEHTFLNVRTYVRVGDEEGIFFLSEYVPKLLARFIGPVTYGLPYRFTQMNYQHHGGGRCFFGDIGRREKLVFAAEYALEATDGEVDEFDDFVHERYNAFTRRRGETIRFRVAHPRWEMHRARMLAWEDGLLERDFPFWDRTQFVAAFFTPGFDDVALGAPVVLREER